MLGQWLQGITLSRTSCVSEAMLLAVAAGYTNHAADLPLGRGD